MFFYISILTFLLLFIFCYNLAPSFKLIDKPNYRKIHKGNIPLIGGLLIYLNLLIFLPYFEKSYHFSIIFYTSAILLILGALDDAIELGVVFRLISQFVSCLIIIGSGLVITNIGDYAFFSKIDMGVLSILFTVLCVIGLTNAFNFIDGMDGLCSGSFLVSISSILVFAYFSNTLNLIIELELVYIIIISVLLFMILNFSNRYKIFLGDSGSNTLGFMISWFLILNSEIYETIHPVLVLWCVSIPSFDIISVIIRRLFRKKNPFKPDRRHIHHILLNIGFDQKGVMIIILSVSLLLNFFGFLIFNLFGPLLTLMAYLIMIFVYLFLSLKLNHLAIKKN